MQEPSTASYCTMNHFRERFQANRVLTMCSSLGESLTLLIFLLGTGCLNSSSYADTGGQLEQTVVNSTVYSHAVLGVPGGHAVCSAPGGQQEHNYNLDTQKIIIIIIVMLFYCLFCVWN